jgi:enoyl-CoA hydratase/carnithine racemase
MDREDGVLTVRMHTNGREAVWSNELHKAIGQAFEVIGNDRDNEIMILTGTGEYWLRNVDRSSYEAYETDEEMFKRRSHDLWYRDGLRLLENLVHDVDIPTIAVVNGPGFHTEFALVCDLTICATDAFFVERHVHVGLVPGDGQFLVFQHLLGTKRANAAMYFAQPIGAEDALRLGLVNEVLPRGELMSRAFEISQHIKKSDPTLRRITTHLVKRPWRKLLTEDAEMHFAHEMWQALVHRVPHGVTPTIAKDNPDPKE